MEIVNEIKTGKKFVIRKKDVGDIVDVQVEKSEVVEKKVENVDVPKLNVGNVGKKEFIPSIYQQNVFDFIKEQVKIMEIGGIPKNLQIIAGAGCAKSTTIVKSTHFIPEKFHVGFFAFNRDIVEDLRDKVPSNCRAQTFHGAGLGAIRYVYKNVRVDDKNRKMIDIFQRLVEGKYRNLDRITTDIWLNPFRKLIGLLKNTYLEPTNSNLEFIIDEYNVDVDDESEYNDIHTLFDMIRDGLEISNANPYLVDYDDMIYLPVKLNLRFYPLDVVMVDETQDLNGVQLLMLEKIVKKGGFVVCVGDPNQAIYRFRGADSEAMDRIQKKLNAVILPLQRTYRCGKAIVRLANELVPELEADIGNVEGEVRENISYDEFYQIVSEGDMIVCRNNAPLIRPAFKMLADGKKVSIKGRDIGEGLIKLVKKFKVSTIDEFDDALEKWKDDQMRIANRKKQMKKIQSIEDKYDCLDVISEGCNNVGEIITKIENIFSDVRSAINLGTVHKVKGLEVKDVNNKVFIIEPKLIPSKYATGTWIKEERNILYVAITRAKGFLGVVGGKINMKF